MVKPKFSTPWVIKNGMKQSSYCEWVNNSREEGTKMATELCYDRQCRVQSLDWGRGKKDPTAVCSQTWSGSEIEASRMWRRSRVQGNLMWAQGINHTEYEGLKLGLKRSRRCEWRDDQREAGGSTEVDVLLHLMWRLLADVSAAGSQRHDHR